METNAEPFPRLRNIACQRPRTTYNGQRRAFTLVELLVVITIIGILVALVTVAAVGALRKARETEIKTEIDQIATALETYKDKATSYPPNCQTDGTGADAPIDEDTVIADLRRHMKQYFPRHQESDNLLRALAGLAPAGGDAGNYPRRLAGGLSAGEAVVFWLGGFSSDPKYPISGEGGPAYPIQGLSGPERVKADPVETRRWIFPFAVERLGPRDSDNYFAEADGRYIEYTDPRGVARRINFWQYAPRRSNHPYLYFDTSRHPAFDRTVAIGQAGRYDPPAATALSPFPLHVHAIKRVHPNYSPSGQYPPIDFVNPEKFQVIHCGVDEEWGEETFERMSAHAMQSLIPDDYLLYPDGPFIGEIADTITNFATTTRLEDAQP